MELPKPKKPLRPPPKGWGAESQRDREERERLRDAGVYTTPR